MDYVRVSISNQKIHCQPLVTGAKLTGSVVRALLLPRQLKFKIIWPPGNLFFFFLNKFIYFIYLFLAALGLCCCVRAFSSCGERGLLFVAVHRLLIAVASLVAEHGLQAHGLQQLWHMGSAVVARGPQSAGSVVVAHGLSCSAACGIFPDQGSNPCPLHWQADS